MRVEDAWAQCRLEVAAGGKPIVVEETGKTPTGAVARAAGVLQERLKDWGYEATLEDLLGAIEQAIAASIARHEVLGSAS